MNYKRLGMDKIIQYQKYLKNFKYNHDENDILFERYQKATGNEKIAIKNRIIENNLQLVVHFLIKKYNYEVDINPVFDMDDIIQEANLALINCIDSYDYTKGKFSTFVYYKLECIVYYSCGIPNTPVNFYRGVASRYKKVKRCFDLDFDDNYISECFNIPIDVIERLRKIFSYSSYEEMLEQGTIVDVMKNKDQIDGDLKINQLIEEDNIVIRNKKILKALDKLSDRDKKMLVLMYGLNGTDAPSKKCHLNKEFGYKNSLIYHREKYALKKLSENEQLREVVDLVNNEFDYNIAEKTYYLQK